MALYKIKKFINKIKIYVNFVSKKPSYKPRFKLAEINLNEKDEYIATIQIINKNILFNIKPETVLAKDNFVDLFSPRDIRTLTYLGYLGINSPKYKILAKRLSEDNDRIIFALKKRGDSNLHIKTTDEILNEKEILENLNSKDAHLVGYAIASESFATENKEKMIACSEMHRK